MDLAEDALEHDLAEDTTTDSVVVAMVVVVVKEHKR